MCSIKFHNFGLKFTKKDFKKFIVSVAPVLQQARVFVYTLRVGSEPWLKIFDGITVTDNKKHSSLLW
jgi:hypothetical protein